MFWRRRQPCELFDVWPIYRSSSAFLITPRKAQGANILFGINQATITADRDDKQSPNPNVQMYRIAAELVLYLTPPTYVETGQTACTRAA